MKKNSLLVGTAALLAGAIGSYLFYKEVAKNYKKNKKQKEDMEKKFKENGLSKEQLEKHMIPIQDDENLEKALFATLLSDPNWDLDMINPRVSYLYENTVHLYRKNNKSFCFAFEIPESALEKSGTLNSKDYFIALSNFSQKMWATIGGNCPPPKWCFRGYFILEGTHKNGYIRTSTYEIANEAIPKKYFTDNTGKPVKDPIISFTRDFRNNSKEMSKAYSFEQEDWNFQIIDILLTFEISFKTQDVKNGWSGVNLINSKKILEKIVSSLEIKKGSKEETKVTYEHFLFHPDFGQNLCDYYIKSGDEIVVDIAENSIPVQ